MLFDQFVNSILSIFEERTEDFRRLIPSNYAARRQNLKQEIPQEEIKDLCQLQKRIFRLMNLAVRMTALEFEIDKETETWSTRLFRGHKSINPFSKLGDSKAEGDKVYWAKYARTALTYSANSNSWGTSGQQFVNIAMKAGEAAGESMPTACGTEFRIGYLSVAEPKYPKSLKWYKNFGYETEKYNKRKTAAEEREKLEKENPGKLYTGISSPYYRSEGLTKDEWEKEQQQLDDRWHTPEKKGIRSPVLFHNPETALSKYDVTKVRTYLIYEQNREELLILSLEKIKKYDPILYQVLLWDRI
jgi:hypothetical protein